MNRKRFLDLIRSHKKGELMAGGALALLALTLTAGAGFSAYRAIERLDTSTQTKAHEPAVTLVASPLTGRKVSEEVAGRPVTAVMIENSPEARPQSGLAQAGVVFEAVAEGGITRFMAFYQDSRPDKIGPVRSLRPYYLDLANGFDAPVAHVGGSPEALDRIRGGDGRDLDQFFNSGAYYRSSDRYAPHNMYTSMDALAQLNQQKGFTGSDFEPWVRQEGKSAETADAASISFNISSPLYNTGYAYDAASNSYARSMAGKPHTDQDGKRIQPNAVIAFVTDKGRNGQYTTYRMTGSGQALIFQNGTVKKATWKKSGTRANISFVDDAGQPVPINVGNTWITALGSAGDVSYGP